jgi:hypothetical protein
VVDLEDFVLRRGANRLERLIILRLHGLIGEVRDERIGAVRSIALHPLIAIEQILSPALQQPPKYRRALQVDSIIGSHTRSCANGKAQNFMTAVQASLREWRRALRQSRYAPSLAMQPAAL